MHRRAVDLCTFFDFNKFLILKMGKKLEGVMKICHLQQMQQEEKSLPPPKTQSGNCISIQYLFFFDPSPTLIVTNVAEENADLERNAVDKTSDDGHESSSLPTWSSSVSYAMFSANYITKEQILLDIQNEALRNYRSIFRTTFPELTSGELKYTKQNDKERRFSGFNIRLGMKFGIILSVFGALFVNALLLRDLSPIWRSYGLNVYSALGRCYSLIHLC